MQHLEVFPIYSQLRNSPPCAINPSRHVTVVGKNIFNSSFCPIRSENVRRCTLMIHCTTLMDTWSDALLLILPAARTAESCKMEPSLGPVGFLPSSSLSLSSWVLAVSSLITSSGIEVCVACASSPSVVTGVTISPFAVCSSSSGSLSESTETLLLSP